MAFPEVAYAVAKVARADTSTDPAPLEHDGNRRPSEAARPVARGHDARSASRGDGSRRSTARRLDDLDDADHQPHRHAHDRHPIRGGREGVWDEPRRPRRVGQACRRGRTRCSWCEQRVPGAGDQRPVPEYRGGSVCSGPVRHRRRRHPAGDRKRGGRDRPDA